MNEANIKALGITLIVSLVFLLIDIVISMKFDKEGEQSNFPKIVFDVFSTGITINLILQSLTILLRTHLQSQSASQALNQCLQGCDLTSSIFIFCGLVISLNFSLKSLIKNTFNKWLPQYYSVDE